MLVPILFILILRWAFSTAEQDPCLLEVDPGPCKYYQVFWYWDSALEQCKKFHYGGCLGNKNRFVSKQVCVKQCIYKMHNPAVIPDLCLLPKDPGYCKDDRKGLWWWYFNAEVGECEKFYYYGCKGNANRFYSMYYCRRVCGERLAPQAACDKCDLRKSYCVAQGKFNYTCVCRAGFEKDLYGQCGDIDECHTYIAECDKNAWCINTVGSYRCQCMAGYRGDGKKCTYVGLGRATMDCHACHKHATCNNGICQCNLGFRGDGFECKDVNECLGTPYPCHKDATCQNSPGSFICKCKRGLAGNGFACTETTKSCLDKFDRDYEEECAPGIWEERYYYNHDTMRCSLMWYSGCNGTNRNIFSDLHTCEYMCERSKVLTRARICWDTFDPEYKGQCSEGHWDTRYYFDQASLTCRMFWYDQCRGSSRNMFNDLLSCQWLCEVQPMFKSKSCLEDFDQHYKDQCGGGRWRMFFYYDNEAQTCRSFWYDSCKGDSQNIFPDMKTCQATCEEPAMKSPPSRWDKSRQPYPSLPPYEPEPFTPNPVCNPSPCHNNAVCEPRGQGYYCHCTGGFTGFNCTIPADNPCLANPCKNGGVCSVINDPVRKFVCDCPPGVLGDLCEGVPCLSSPCLNGGTCKTTKGWKSYWCECPEKFSGNRCQIEKGTVGLALPTTLDPHVITLSSGKEEWLHTMAERTGLSIGPDFQGRTAESTGETETKEEEPKEMTMEEEESEESEKESKESESEASREKRRQYADEAHSMFNTKTGASFPNMGKKQAQTYPKSAKVVQNDKNNACSLVGEVGIAILGLFVSFMNRN